MEVLVTRIPYDADHHDFKRKIHEIVHSDEFPARTIPTDPGQSRLVNFDVFLKPSEVGHLYSDGKGKIIFPTQQVGEAFLAFVYGPAGEHHRKWVTKEAKQKLTFKRSEGKHLRKAMVETLAKTPYVSVDIEEKYDHIIAELDQQLRINHIQIGRLYYKHEGIGGPRLTFSAEWAKNLVDGGAGWLKFDYASKLIRIKLGNPSVDSTGHSVLANFATIRRLLLGQDGPNPYMCIQLDSPCVLEEIDLHPSGDPNVRSRRRVSAVDDKHAAIAPYVHDIRLILYAQEDVLGIIKELCRVSEIDVKLEELLYRDNIDVHGPKNYAFFQAKTLDRLQTWFKQLPFSVSFQLEALLREGLVTPEDILKEPIFPEINCLAGDDDTEASEKLSQLLMHFRNSLQIHDPSKETPGCCFLRTKREFKYFAYTLPNSSFKCYHLTFTPTRVLLEGPYAVQSNRIMRRYQGYERNFMRVDFRDEDRLQYRWDRQVDGSRYLQHRVGRVLQDGFTIGGQYFQFLAYSSSALREHAVWFMHDFQLSNGEWVNPQKIRGSLGDFHDLLKQPSKLAARVAQAFTATDPSVTVHRHEWEEIDDMEDGCTPPNMFTDGCGIISKALGDRIWAVLISQRSDQGVNLIKPWVYQIRFLGFKGVVCVSPALDSHPRGIQMQLRKSMKKFENRTDESADIEIARAFNYPNQCYLNRPLITLLEDRGVRIEAFKRLQQAVVREVYTIDESISKFYTVLRNNSLGGTFRLGWLLQQTEQLLGIAPDTNDTSWDNSFWRRLRNVAVHHVLRDIKHRARILIPDSHMLVGIADEGPRYKREGRRNVYTLPAGRIYACIQNADDPEPTWLEGLCLIARNPVVHPGDVQHVTAIGKPPADGFCAFRDVVNAVVLPSEGKRALASCLSGGDVDGDQFVIIQCESLLAATHHAASDYPAVGVRTLDRECTVDDVCDFIVEYIQSDVLGLLSTRHLIIADQSKEGSKDPKCLKISALCSQAVDYPKNGIPVDATDLPKTLMRCNPDWQAAEVLKPRDTDFYESDRALGHLFRAITLEEPPNDNNQDPPPLLDPVSVALQSKLQDILTDRPDDIPSTIVTLFTNHVDELKCIAATHTVSNTPGARLIEEEMVVGTILAKCAQHRWRSDRTQRMLYHTSAHVRNLQSEFCPNQPHMDRGDYASGIRRAWSAWKLSQERRSEFGAASFGLIALAKIFDLMEKMPAEEQ